MLRDRQKRAVFLILAGGMLRAELRKRKYLAPFFIGISGSQHQILLGVVRFDFILFSHSEECTVPLSPDEIGVFQPLVWLIRTAEYWCVFLSRQVHSYICVEYQAKG